MQTSIERRDDISVFIRCADHFFLHANPSRATSLASTNHSVMPANPWKLYTLDPIIALNSSIRPGDPYLDDISFLFFSPIRDDPFRLGSSLSSITFRFSLAFNFLFRYTTTFLRKLS